MLESFRSIFLGLTSSCGAAMFVGSVRTCGVLVPRPCATVHGRQLPLRGMRTKTRIVIEVTEFPHTHKKKIQDADAPTSAAAPPPPPHRARGSRWGKHGSRSGAHRSPRVPLFFVFSHRLSPCYSHSAFLSRSRTLCSALFSLSLCVTAQLSLSLCLSRARSASLARALSASRARALFLRALVSRKTVVVRARY